MGLFSRSKAALGIFFGIGSYEDVHGQKAPVDNAHIQELAIKNSFIASVANAYRYGATPTATNIQFTTRFPEFNDSMEDIIHAWSKRGNCEISGDYYRGSLEQSMIVEYAAKSGGYLLRHHYSKAFTFGYKVELLTLSDIDTNETNEDNRIKNGFKFNKYGEITGIYLINDDGTSDLVPYNKLTLVINKWVSPKQRSGLSPLRPIMEGLEYIDSYRTAELEGMEAIAKNPHFIKTTYFKDIIKAKLKEKGKTRDRLSADEIRDIFSQRRADVGKISKFTYISDDEDVISPNEHKQSVYADLFDKEYAIASSGVGLTSMSTVGASPSSYNAALKGQAWEDRVFESVIEQNVELAWEEMITDRLIEGLELKGICPVDDYQSNKWAYRHVLFIRKGLPHIDPAKAAKATSSNIKENGTSSMAEELRKKGKDPEKHLREKYEYKKLKKKIKEEVMNEK